MNAVALLKSQARQPAIHNQRKPSECNINTYTIHLLRVWDASMDIPFITYVYACEMYIATYTSKPKATFGDLKPVIKSVL